MWTVLDSINGKPHLARIEAEVDNKYRWSESSSEGVSSYR